MRLCRVGFVWIYFARNAERSLEKGLGYGYGSTDEPCEYDAGRIDSGNCSFD